MRAMGCNDRERPRAGAPDRPSSLPIAFPARLSTSSEVESGKALNALDPVVGEVAETQRVQRIEASDGRQPVARHVEVVERLIALRPSRVSSASSCTSSTTRCSEAPPASRSSRCPPATRRATAWPPSMATALRVSRVSAMMRSALRDRPSSARTSLRRATTGRRDRDRRPPHGHRRPRARARDRSRRARAPRVRRDSA